MDGRSIQVARVPLDARVRATPSKSVTHRALVAAALASGPSSIDGPLNADDTRVTRRGLEALGFEVGGDVRHWDVVGRGGHVPGGGVIDLGESGTSFRLLTAVASLATRPCKLDGASRLRERPIGELVGALRALGARLEAEGGDRLPLVAGGAAPAGGAVVVSGGRSSQFASALLMIGSRLPGGLELRVQPPAVSIPYVELTARVLQDFGVRVEHPEPLVWRVHAADYDGRSYRVEGDHSSASYFLAAAAIAGGRVRVEGLDPGSPQPDGRLAALLEGVGCTIRRGSDWIEVEGNGEVRAFDLELSEAPDLVPTLAVLALFADGPCELRGIPHVRLKESDRLEVLADDLGRMGARAAIVAGGLRIDPPRVPSRPAMIRTGSDHRIAMAFAVAGLRCPGIVLDDAGCVSKSNPDFWSAFADLEGSSPENGPG